MWTTAPLTATSSACARSSRWSMMTSRRSRPSTVSATATETAEPKAAAASGAKRRRSGRPEERTGETIAPRRSQLRGRQESSAEARRRLPAWRSPLTRRILLINTLVLLIPVLGLLHLEQYRQSLIDSEIEAMRTQATIVALALGSAAIRDGPQGDQQLMQESARQLIRVLLSDISLSAPLRARLFSQSGELVADSFMLGGPEAVVRVEELPPPQSRGLAVIRWIEDFYDKNMRRLLYPDALPLYQEQPRQSAAHYNEVEQA